jgi:hypothetical protein
MSGTVINLFTDIVVVGALTIYCLENISTDQPLSLLSEPGGLLHSCSTLVKGAVQMNEGCMIPIKVLYSPLYHSLAAIQEGILPSEYLLAILVLYSCYNGKVLLTLSPLLKGISNSLVLYSDVQCFSSQSNYLSLGT